MTRVEGALLAGAIVLAGAIYLAIGRPGMADQPMAVRTAELERKAPEEMTPDEWLARLGEFTRQRPEDPQPHFFIGELLASQGRDEDAVRAFQSALRRDNSHVPALMGLGDALLRMSNGEVSGELAVLFARAFELDPRQTRSAFLVGVSAWQQGDRAGAEETWARTAQSLPEGSVERRRFDALVGTFIAESEANSAAVPPEPK
ncbi:MAG: tetratricopeptide repeat protein [Pseudomonadota bacterium]